MEPDFILLTMTLACTVGLTLLLVPFLAKMAVVRGLVDKPNARKVHQKAVPRIGGVAIVISLYCALAVAYLLFPAQVGLFAFAPKYLFLILGSMVAFGIGLADDFKGLRARKKLVFQVVAAGLAYFGGIRVETIGFYNLFQMDLGWLSPVVTMFWIVLVINAFNLIDGLDGLAGGVGVIACTFLAYVCFLRGNIGGQVLMIATIGGLLGFLRYNFYPASVFMGDGGSYFLGYLLGTISAYCASSNSATLSTLIPMLVVALPIIDVSMATMRRFVHGREIFSPDKQHFHHMLLRLGLSHRNAVLVLWGFALFIGCCALVFLRIKDEKAYLLLMVMGVVILFGINKLGYFKNYDLRAIVPWLNGISDEMGLSQERRSFFDIQTKIGSATVQEELWRHLAVAMEMLGFMTCAIYLQAAQKRKKGQPERGSFSGQHERRKMPALHTTVAMRQAPPDWFWTNPHEAIDQHNRSVFRVEMDLQDDDHITYGTLLIIKNQAVSPVSHYTLKRIEHLKRSIIKALINIERARQRAEANQPDGALEPRPAAAAQTFENLKN